MLGQIKLSCDFADRSKSIRRLFHRSDCSHIRPRGSETKSHSHTSCGRLRCVRRARLEDAIEELTSYAECAADECRAEAAESDYSDSGSPETPLIRAFSRFDDLKTKTRRSLIGTSTPVFGLRPIRSPLWRTLNDPNEESRTGSPATSRSVISSRTCSTSAADSFRDRPTC